MSIHASFSFERQPQVRRSTALHRLPVPSPAPFAVDALRTTHARTARAEPARLARPAVGCLGVCRLSGPHLSAPPVPASQSPIAARSTPSDTHGRPALSPSCRRRAHIGTPVGREGNWGATRGQYRRHEAGSAGSLKTMPVLTPRGGETLVAPHRHRRSQERGWRCVRGPHPHRAPCALVPRWWNVVAKLRWEWQSFPL